MRQVMFRMDAEGRIYEANVPTEAPVVLPRGKGNNLPLILSILTIGAIFYTVVGLYCFATATPAMLALGMAFLYFRK